MCSSSGSPRSVNRKSNTLGLMEGSFATLMAFTVIVACVSHSHQVRADTDGGHHHGHDGHDHHDHDHDHEHDHQDFHKERARGSVTALTWVASSTAIFLISLCGVFGVLVIPIMRKIFYQHLIQFLVALAIGTLAGDALLHLLPHALMHGLELESSQHEAFHQTSIWKGCFALGALLSFFVIEKFVNIAGEWRERRAAEKLARDETNLEKKESIKKAKKKVKIVRTGHVGSEKVVGERQCKHKYSSYCVTDVDPEDQEEKQTSLKVQVQEPEDNEDLHSEKKPLNSLDEQNDDEEDEEDDEEAALSSYGRSRTSSVNTANGENNCLPGGGGRRRSKPHPHVTSLGRYLSDSQIIRPDKSSILSINGGGPAITGGEAASKIPLTPTSPMSGKNGYETVFIRDHELTHHGHSHIHSHIHSKPESISSVGKF